MRFREAIASSLHLLVVLSYFALAIGFFLLPKRIDWIHWVSLWLTEKPQLFYWIGAMFAIAGLLFFVGFFQINRGRYLRIVMSESKQASIDIKLIRRVLEAHFKKLAPHILGTDVFVAKSNQLEITLELPSKDAVEGLEDMEEKLRELLEKRFGYKGSLTLFVRSR